MYQFLSRYLHALDIVFIDGETEGTCPVLCSSEMVELDLNSGMTPELFQVFYF